MLFPKRSDMCWLVTDIWEVFCAVPVIVVDSGIPCMVCLHTSEDDIMALQVPRNRLFRKRVRAERKARRLNQRSGAW